MKQTLVIEKICMNADVKNTGGHEDSPPVIYSRKNLFFHPPPHILPQLQRATRAYLLTWATHIQVLIMGGTFHA